VGFPRLQAREDVNGTSRTLIGTIFWTILSVFTVLVGLQLFQLAFYTSSILGLAGFLLTGVLVLGASLYLLYLLHWK